MIKKPELISFIEVAKGKLKSIQDTTASFLIEFMTIIKSLSCC